MNIDADLLKPFIDFCNKKRLKPKIKKYQKKRIKLERTRL